MNLKNFIEESDAGFWGISAICSVFSVVVLVYGLNRLRRVQRVSMWGNDCGPLPPARITARSTPWNAHEMGQIFAAEERAAGLSGAAGKAHAAKMYKVKQKMQDMKAQQLNPQGPLWTKAQQQAQVQASQHASKTGSAVGPKKTPQAE
jgi:hypothetical protein